MKKFATRVLALIVALSMLLVSTAFAAERNAASLTIGNFELTVDGETISLPVYLNVGGGVDIEGARGYLTASLATETASALSALAAFENGEIKAYLNGMDYGFTVTLEQIVALLEAEMGMTFEEMLAEAMSSIDEDAMAAIADLTETATAMESVEVDPEALLSALGVTLTEQGQTTIALFDVEAAAAAYSIEMKQQTVADMINTIAAQDPAIAAYFEEYFAMINAELAAEGTEMTAEEAIALFSVGVTGSYYLADNGTLTELDLTISAEGESITIPVSILTQTDDAGVYTQVSTFLEVDGEMLVFDVYTDEYTFEGADCTNFVVSCMIGDVDAEEMDLEMRFSFSTQNSEEGPSVNVDLYAAEYGEVVTIGFAYMGAPVVSTEESDSFDGLFYFYADAEGSSVEALFDTNLTLTNVPEGELLTFAQSVNPLEIDEAKMEEISADVQTVLFQALGTLMQDPNLAEMFSGMMMG